MNERITRITVAPPGEPIYSELVTHVEIEDESAGEFVVIKQSGRTDNSIAINPDEWPALRAAIDRMIAACTASPTTEGREP